MFGLKIIISSFGKTLFIGRSYKEIQNFEYFLMFDLGWFIRKRNREQLSHRLNGC
jgi:hypothetical protein